MPLTPKEITAIIVSEYGSVYDAMEESMYGDISEGICLNCGHIQSGVEPDAEGYRCEQCGDPAVNGLETVIMTCL
jgi:hypothetical protein